MLLGAPQANFFGYRGTIGKLCAQQEGTISGYRRTFGKLYAFGSAAGELF